MIDPENKPTPNYVKYSGLAFQMLATIAVFVFVGYKVDQHQKVENSLFTALFGILGVAASLYKVIRSLNKDS